MKRLTSVIMLVLILCAALVLPAGAGTTSAAPQPAAPAAAQVAAPSHAHAAAFDKTRFVLHLAVAAFMIHYVYKKYQEHKLGRFHIFTDIKAAAALLIAYHELKVAYEIAKTSNSKTLHVLIAPMSALGGAVGAAANKIKHGDTSDVSALDSAQNAFQSLAGKQGFKYKDQQPKGFGGF